MKHKISIIERNIPKVFNAQESIQDERVDISGPLCFSDDELSWDEYVHKANIGDIIVVHTTGAYCYTASSIDMLSHPHPEEFILTSI